MTTIRRSAASRLKADPSQTYTLRKRFETEVKRRFNRLKSAILDLVKDEDAFGLAVNFNPSQPRDDQGQWTSGGGGSGPQLSPEEIEKKRVADAVQKWMDEQEQFEAPEATTDIPSHLHEQAAQNLPLSTKRLIQSSHDWEATQPWNMTADEVKGSPLPGFRYEDNPHGEEAHYTSGGNINLSPKFFEQKHEEVRRNIIYHELGHELSDSMLADGTAFQLKDAGVMPGGKRVKLSDLDGQHTPGEVLSQVYATMHSDLPHLEKHFPDLIKPVADRARAMGMPLPKELLTNGRSYEPSNRTNNLLLRNQSLGIRKERSRSVHVEEHEHLGIQKVQSFGQTGQKGNYLRRMDNFEVNSDSSKVVANKRWKFRTNPQKVEEFRLWVQKQTEENLLQASDSTDPNKWWDEYVLEAYRKGQLSSFESVNKQKLGESMDFYKGTREQFLRDSFAQPETVEKVQLLASRVFTDLKGVTEAMASAMSRTLVDGLSQGQNPFTIARQLVKDVDGIGVNRARMIARTEVIRAHAEGQLDALETMGIEEVGVAVEWDDAGDGRVCRLCSAMSGVILTVKEAHGLIPRHVNCRCAFLPANVGESKQGQIRGSKGIQGAFDKSIKREIPKGSKRTLAEQKAKTSWAGADTKIVKKRPKSIIPS